MKKSFKALLLILVIPFMYCSAQTQVLQIDGLQDNCDDPPILTDNSNEWIDVFITTGEVTSTILVSYEWVLCQGGEVVAVSPERAVPLDEFEKLTFFAQPNGNGQGDGDDFPNDLESGVYEVKLRSCFTYRNGTTTAVEIRDDGEVLCRGDLLLNDGTFCCEVSVGCYDYRTCPEVSIRYNSKKGILEGVIPPSGNVASMRWVISQKNSRPRVVKGVQSVIPLRGCWTYEFVVVYDDGCISRDETLWCSFTNEEDDLPMDDDPEGGIILDEEGKGERRSKSASLKAKVFPSLMDVNLNIELPHSDYVQLSIVDASGKVFYQNSI